MTAYFKNLELLTFAIYSTHIFGHKPSIY